MTKKNTSSADVNSQDAQATITQEVATVNNTQDVATADAEAGMLIGQSQDLFKTSLMAMWTSIDPANKSLILKASGDADYNLMAYFDKNPGGFIEVVDVLVHNVQIADDEAADPETGELHYITATRTVLIDKNGLTYASVSQGVGGSLQKIFALYGWPTWSNGLKMTARRVQTRKFQTINLLVLD